MHPASRILALAFAVLLACPGDSPSEPPELAPPYLDRWRLGSALSEAYLALGRPKFAAAARAEAAEWERTWQLMSEAE